MNKILLILFIIIPITTSESTLSKNKYNIFNHIKRINNKVEHKTVISIGFTIAKYADKYKLDRRLLVAIIAQESMFNVKAKNKNDYGIAQINKINIKHMKLSKNRLLKDYDYSIEAMCKILYNIKNRNGKEKDWWTRYNSKYDYSRKIYKKKVMRWY